MYINILTILYYAINEIILCTRDDTGVLGIIIIVRSIYQCLGMECKEIVSFNIIIVILLLHYMFKYFNIRVYGD